MNFNTFTILLSFAVMAYSLCNNVISCTVDGTFDNPIVTNSMRVDPYGFVNLDKLMLCR